MEKRIFIAIVWFLGSWMHQSIAAAQSLTFEERVKHQQAIEEVYWRHRTWPKENRAPKPAFASVVPESTTRFKVDEYLRKSDALERYWQRAVTPEQLQAEMQRMARDSKQPAVLRELWSALNNDPYLIAECLARPALVDRLIHKSYAFDERLHGTLQAQVSGELARISSASQLSLLSGNYEEITWKREGNTKSHSELNNGAFDVASKDWDQKIFEVRKNLIATELSTLQEDEDRYYAFTILQQEQNALKLGVVSWKKQNFEEWWENAKLDASAESKMMPEANYSLPDFAAAASSVENSWSSIGSPAARNFHTGVWTGSELIIWGGRTSGADEGMVLFDSGARYSPATDSWAPMTSLNSPSRRLGHSAVWTGTEMIVWGGLEFTYELNTGGKYDPATDQWTATNVGGAPEGRWAHTAVWTGSEMIVWGGQGASDKMNSGARYNPTADSWIAVAQNNDTPVKRYWHSAVWTGSQMIIWGGEGTATAPSTGGIYNLSTNSWVAGGLNPVNAPAERTRHRAIWTGSEMIIWGGKYADFMNTGARYNPATNTWTPTSLVNAPTGREMHSAIWTGNEMIIWGGDDGTGPYGTNTGGRYNATTNSWSTTTTTGAPHVRRHHAAVWTGSEMIVWGGIFSDGAGGELNTGGRYNPATNSWLAGGTSASTPPVPRLHPGAVWTGSEMIIWGGLAYYGPLNSGRIYTPATDSWAAAGTNTVDAPSIRYQHTTIWTGTEMVVWGGLGAGNAALNTGGRYNPVTNLWTPGGTSMTNVPPARGHHSGIWTGQELLVWGGFGVFGPLNSGGRYNPSLNSWQVNGTSLINPPTGRYYHSTVWTGSEMIVWGGIESGGTITNSGGRYTPATNSWAINATSISPTAARSRHSAVWTGSEMIVFGGRDINGLVMNSGGRYNPANNTWTQGISLAGAPAARSEHSAIWTGTEMIIWGGYNGGAFGDGGRYNPSSNSWNPEGISTVNAPEARYSHSVIWTGSEMIVWGGHNGIAPIENGGRYFVQGSGGSNLLFFDDFEDQDATDWTFTKGSWTVVNGELTGSSDRKADLLSPDFGGCTICTIDTEIRIDTPGDRVSILGWYTSKTTFVEIAFMSDKGKVLLKQKSNGVTVAKQAAAAQLTSGVNYSVQVAFDGSNFSVVLDGNTILTVPAGTTPAGKVAYRVKAATSAMVTVKFQEISVY